MTVTQRFLQYVQIHTTSSENSKAHPSFAGEFDLANLLSDQLKELGAASVVVDEHCYVYALIPATAGYEEAPCLGFISHMDTSPECSGKDVHPIIHENYDGENVVLGKSGRVIDTALFSDMKKLRGETLITSDGTTLLGADDKAGIAEIMTMLEHLYTEQIPHGPIRVAFTPDEEIGEGTDLFDLQKFPAAYAYTVDGGDVDELEYENFNAAAAKVTVQGLSVHPGYAKDLMRNALNIAMEFHARFPKGERPEHTVCYEGFYHLTDFTGTVSKAELHYIIRDHDRAKFEERKTYFEKQVEEMNRIYGDGVFQAEITDTYYNMLEKILPHMHLVETAKAALTAEGILPKICPIRGGTDGARLSFEGLPCPNIGTGGFHFHGEYECITVERMECMVRVLLRIVDTYKDFRLK